VGTIQFAWLSLVFALLGGTLHSLAGASGASRECALGLSGVIFSLVVVDSHLTPTATRTIFGCFNVATRWYPLALLAFLQLLLPSASVLGHLSGVIIGYAYCWGYLNWAVLSQTSINTLERARCLAGVVARPQFVLATGLPDPHGGGLPRWITAPGGEAAGLRAPGWMQRAWAQAQAAAGVSSPTSSAVGGGGASGGGGVATFVGRGRTLGAEAGGGGGAGAGAGLSSSSQTQLQTITTLSAAATQQQQRGANLSASAADARARAARAAEARYMQQSNSGGGYPSAASAVAAAASGLLPTGSARLEATPPGLSQLVAMGFEEQAAREALVATQGDVSAAIDKLSS
jgi:hypothetical protein